MVVLDLLDKEVLAKSWWTRRSPKTARRITRLCVDDWQDVVRGRSTRKEICTQYREAYYGNPMVLILIQILVPIIIEMIKRFLNSRNDGEATLLLLQRDVNIERTETGW